MEKAVTIKIEEAVRDVEGIEKVDSYVSEGFSTTFLTLFNDVNDIDSVLQEVKNEVDAVQDLPDDIEQVVVSKVEPRLPVISVALYGDVSDAELKTAARDLRDDLLALPGISDVEITGTRDDEISVDVMPDRLREYNVTFDEVAESIRSTNLDVSGGQLRGDRERVAVRTLGEESHGRDLEDIVVKGEASGRQIFLSDVANVRDTFVESDLEAYFNGKPAVTCIVYKTKSQDAIQISTLVKAYVQGKKNGKFDPYGFAAASNSPWYSQPLDFLACGLGWLANRLAGRPDPMVIFRNSQTNPFDHNLQVDLHSDLARFVEGRLDLMTRNGKTGLILVLISLNLFLNWRVAFWASVGLPVAFLGTFIMMALLGVFINLFSMFGLIIVLGIIVDDAIVIGENIYRHVEDGMSPREAAIKGAEEVMWPVTAAVTTTIAAFAPLLFIKGRIGDFMKELPLVVLAALTVSLIEALLILPAHLAHLPTKAERALKSRRHGPLMHLFDVFRAVQSRVMGRILPDLYERLLSVAIRWRYITLAVAVGLLMTSLGLFAGGVVESVFIQQMDSETLICSIEMPVGTPADLVRKRVQQVNDFVVGLPEVSNVQTFVARNYDFAGGGALNNDQSHLGQIVVELLAADVREQEKLRSSFELLTVFREKSGGLAGVNSITWEAMNGGPGGKDVEIRISGKKIDEIQEVAQWVKDELNQYEGVFDVDDDFDAGKREVRIELRETARPAGVTVATVGNNVRSAFFGREARRITRNREDVKIMVRYPESFRKNVYNVETMWIPSPDGPDQRGWIPLAEVARLEETESYSTIRRSQQQRALTVYAEVDDEQTSSYDILANIGREFEEEVSPQHPQVRLEFLGTAEERRKSFAGLTIAFPVALLMIYMLLAGLFRSYFQPIVVMSAIPFGIQGAIVGHWVTGNPMTILSWIGLVALTGIVVNDSLVLVDFINSRVRDGMTLVEATLKGSRLRLRAILLTSVTTIAGLMPLMFERSFQAKFLIPMAVTLTFGLAFATALTLILVPCLNLIFFDIMQRLHWLWTGEKNSTLHLSSELPAEREAVGAGIG